MPPTRSTRAAESVLPKACENCRTRKIRCNRVFPCSNCQTSKIECRPRGAVRAFATRQALQGPDVLPNYEERLLAVEDQLRALSPHSLQGRGLSGASPGLVVREASSSSTYDHGTTFEGASSLNHQLSRAIQNPELNFRHAKSLRSLTEGTLTWPNEALRFRHNDLGPSSSTDLRLPPADFVITLLQRFDSKSSAVLCAYHLEDAGSVKRIEDLCQRVYFPTKPISQGGLATLYGLLFYLIQECRLNPDMPPAREHDWEVYEKLCEDQFHKTVESYEILVVPTFENIKALQVGITKAQDEGKTWLSWTMTSCAARHLFSLGYHLASSYLNDSPRFATEKYWLFWGIYSSDKTLSLKLGRASNMRDSEIEIDYPEPSSDPALMPWDLDLIAMFKLARLQGRLYDKLYTFKSQKKSPEMRRRIVDQLTQDFEQWHHEYNQVDISNCFALEIFETINRQIDVTYYSLLTTLHRAISSRDSTRDVTTTCYNYACRSLESHLKAFRVLRTPEYMKFIPPYIAWVLLYASFTPIIAVFLHALSSNSHADIELLRNMKDSLEDIKEAEWIHGVCQTLYHVADSHYTNHSSYQANGDLAMQDDVPLRNSDNINLTETHNLANTTRNASSSNANMNSSYGSDDLYALFGDWFLGSESATRFIQAEAPDIFPHGTWP